jgi:hypothetical protein
MDSPIDQPWGLFQHVTSHIAFYAALKHKLLNFLQEFCL